MPFAPLTLSPAAAGLHYGQAMFEGSRPSGGSTARSACSGSTGTAAGMASGAARLCMPAPAVELMRRGAAHPLGVERGWVPPAPGTALYLRPTLLATEPFLGVRPAAEYLFFVIASPVAAYFGAGGGPLRLAVEERWCARRPAAWAPSRRRPTTPPACARPRTPGPAGYDQVLWTDAHAHSAIEEAGTMNVFVHIGDEIADPAARRHHPGRRHPRLGHRAAAALGPAACARGGSPWKRSSRPAAPGGCARCWAPAPAAGVAAIGELGWRGERIVVGDGGEGPLARRLGSALLRDPDRRGARSRRLDDRRVPGRAGQRVLKMRNRSHRLGSQHRHARQQGVDQHAQRARVGGGARRS